MAVVPYISYLGGWEQGDPIILYLPIIPAGTPAPSSDYWAGIITQSNDWNAIVAAYATWFERYSPLLDMDATVFTSDKATVESLGFTHVIELDNTETTSYDFYTNEHDFFRFTIYAGRQSPITAMYYNDTYIYSVSRPYQTGTPSMTVIPSYTEGNLMSYSWTIGTDGYGRANHFTGGELNYGQPMFDFFANMNVYHEPTDPYAGGGISSEGGGTGSFDLTGDDIDIPNLPTLSATNAGLVTVYIPTASELRNFGELIFGSTFLNAFLNAVTNLFVDPLEAIVGLAILPVSPSVGELQDVKVGFVPLNYTEGGEGHRLQMHPATSQYVVVDCGSLTIDEYSGSALDYAPYSKFHVYLPYIGTRELSTDEIRNKTMHIVYHVDIVSGACVAIIEVDGTVLYQFAGNCATPIPINGRDFSRMITASIQLASAFVGASSGSGSGTAVAGNPTPSDSQQVTQASYSTLGDEGTKPDTHKQPGRKASGEHLISTTASVVAGMKTHIQHASGIGGSAGMLGVQKPYLIAELPRQSLAKDYNKFIGYPSNITSLLGDLTGFTQIEMIHLKDIPCTETELAEINDMLMEGVIL